MSFTRCIFRWGLVAGLVVGGVTLLVGPRSMATYTAQIRAKAQNVVESCIDDPVLLRQQLKDMADEYPDRINEVRGEIAEVEHQLGQYERDIEIAHRVIAMATDDLDGLRELVARAEAEKANGTRTVAIRMDGIRFDLDQAYSQGRRIKNIRTQYQDRLASDKVQQQFLAQQKDRLAEILTRLEDEFGTYQTQLWQLDRQIEAIQRNERLIELTEDQQATLESYSRFEAPKNLHQLEAHLARLRAEQEAQLETLAKRGFSDDYEDRALFELKTAPHDNDPFADIIELGLDDETEEVDPVRWDEPIIIE